MSDSKNNGSLPYIKVFPEEYLGGSLHFGCTLEQQGFFMGILCLAAKNRKERGTLSLEKGTPMSDDMIANALFISPSDCTKLINVMLEQDRLSRRDDGVLYIVNFDYYQNKYRRSNATKTLQREYQIKKTEEERTRVLTNKHPDEARETLETGFGDTIITKENK